MPNITYTFAIGPGHLTQQARWLLQSIHANTDASVDDIVTYVVEDERDDIGAEKLEYFEDRSTVIEGEMPNPGYPLSAAHAALVAASDYSSQDYTLLLDTDTVVLNSITVHEDADAELFVVPEPVAVSFWGDVDQSRDAWENLYDEFGGALPEATQTSIHGDPMLPYFNGGVILVDNGTDFPQAWLELSKELYGELPKDNYYTEMVSLALLTNKYKTKVLPERYNYLAKVHLSAPPDNTKILHYPEQMSLYRAMRNPTIKHRLDQTDIQTHFNELPKIERLVSLGASYAKAYELSHPDSPLSKIITRMIEFQLTFRDLVSKN